MSICQLQYYVKIKTVLRKGKQKPKTKLKNPKQELSYDLLTCEPLITTWKTQDKPSPTPILCLKVIKQHSIL